MTLTVSSPQHQSHPIVYPTVFISIIPLSKRAGTKFEDKTQLKAVKEQILPCIPHQIHLDQSYYSLKNQLLQFELIYSLFVVSLRLLYYLLLHSETLRCKKKMLRTDTTESSNPKTNVNARNIYHQVHMICDKPYLTPLQGNNNQL